MATTEHAAHCIDLAKYSVQDELDAQGIETALDITDPEAVLTIPAWNMTMDEVVAQWLADGNITCNCH